MSEKNRLYLALDITIALAFVLSIASGLVWLLTDSGGQGGSTQALVLGLRRSTWSDLHTWFSLVMIAGALVHLALHWSWIASMTRRLREGKARKAKLHGSCFSQGDSRPLLPGHPAYHNHRIATAAALRASASARFTDDGPSRGDFHRQSLACQVGQDVI